MADPTEFDPYEPALQHIVLVLVGALAQSQPEPEKWLETFRAKVSESLDGWFPDGVPDAQAAAYRTATAEVAKAMLGSISLRPPRIPPLSGA